jgi:nicotinamidase/pyrazinamidase
MGTKGAEFHPALHLATNPKIVSKGMGEQEDAYSAFQARDESGTDLATLLRAGGIKNLYIGGLATDYCVRSTTLDALTNGFNVTLIPDAIRAVNLQPEDGDKAMSEMRAAGATEYVGT